MSGRAFSRVIVLPLDHEPLWLGIHAKPEVSARRVDVFLSLVLSIDRSEDFLFTTPFCVYECSTFEGDLFLGWCCLPG
jgi:hypothetical protein